MHSFSKRKNKPPQTDARGFILWEGDSVLDGSPIVCIATLETSNKKTGAMVQTWIIRTDMSPIEASKAKKDGAICGNCPHKHSVNGACYVNLGHAPRAVYDGYKRGIYPQFDMTKHGQFLAHRYIRLGAYGDPSAIPYEINAMLVKIGIGHTGYTHQIEHKNFDKRYIDICQVSADTPKQALKYQSMGAKTFRVAMANDSLYDSEIECLADSKGLTCIQCGLCDGQTKNIAIVVHGARKQNFKSNLIQTVEVN